MSMPKSPLLPRFGASTAPLPTTEDEYETLDPKAIEAAHWVDTQIRKLIAEIKTLGKPQGPHTVVPFGILFEELANTFDALSGILKTAKKYHVVDYEGETLYQGSNDHTVVTLLKDTHDGVEIKRRRKTELKGAPTGGKAAGFGTGSLQNAQSKCHICSKTVYAMEFVGASDRAFHKGCFRCLTCNCALKPTDYCTIDDKFYCTPHYTQLFLRNTNYVAAEHGGKEAAP